MHDKHRVKARNISKNVKSSMVLFVVTLLGQSRAQFVGESCTTNADISGICRIIRDCPSAQAELRQGIVPTSCGFQGSTPIVCCPEVATSTTKTPKPTVSTTTTRKTTVSTTTTPRSTVKTTPSSTTTKATTTIPSTTVSSQENFLDIARRKCEGYSRWVYQTEVSPVNLPGSKLERESLCAIDSTPLIVGGVSAKPAEFPHMVSIGYGPEERPSWLCGGSLISENFVLTAAHCLSSQRGDAKWALLGDLTLVENIQDRGPDRNGTILQVVERIRHPDYKSPSKYNDVALLKLDRLPGESDLPIIPREPIPDGGIHPLFSAFIRPACLQGNFEIPFRKALATGWGRTSHGGDTSPDLLKVQLSIIDVATCNDSYSVEATTNRLAQGIVPSQLCAGELQGEKDTCQGDSGGPLQYVLDDIDCMYSLIGVTSFGQVCGFENSPAVYSRVSEFLPWIVENVWPQG